MTVDRVRIAERLDVKGFSQLMYEETGETPSPDVALQALHKARAELGRAGLMPKHLGVQSARWLADRGLWHGVRWWLL